MRSLTANHWARVAIRVGVSATLAVSGVIHAYLYVDGYSHIPTIGPAFLLQAVVFCVLAVLISRQRSALAAVGRGCGCARVTGCICAVPHCGALRIHRIRVGALTGGRSQCDRRGAHRGISCGLCAEQPQQICNSVTGPDRCGVWRGFVDMVRHSYPKPFCRPGVASEPVTK
jgi:hypothetical protein